jgi:hypothetical protein
MVGASLWIWPHWIGPWIKVLLGYHRYATPPLVALLPGATLGPYVGPIAIVGMLGVGAFLAWRSRQASVDSPNFWLTLSLLLAISSVTLLPGQAVYDHIILMPGIFLVLRYRRELRCGGRIPRTLLVLGTIVLCWQWVAALGVIAVHPWISSARLATILTFPIRTAASLPFAVLALLFCAAKINLAESREVS